MSFPARSVAAATLLAGVALTLNPILVAHAGPPRSRAASRDHLAAELHKALRHHGARHLDYRIDDPAYGSFSHSPNHRTAPASNEKLFTAITLLHQVGPDFRYVTPFAGTAKLVGHTIDGDLVVRGSGDPTLSRTALAGIARTLHHDGLHRVTGHLVVDDTRYSKKTIVSGWKRKFVPEETGTVDAFTVDHNVWRGGSGYFHDPTLGNARFLRHQLNRHHVSFGAGIEVRRAPHTVHPLVVHRSPPLSSIIDTTLTESINFDAEMMFREAGAQLTGHGSPATGAAAERSVAADLDVPLGTVHDGSGLSYTDRSSPAILTRWLLALRSEPSFATVYDGLPVSCRTGTLKYRMCGPNVAGEVHAKTGTLTGVSTLSGYETSIGNAPITFSFLASGVRSYAKLYDRIGAALALFRKQG